MKNTVIVVIGICIFIHLISKSRQPVPEEHVIELSHIPAKVVIVEGNVVNEDGTVWDGLTISGENSDVEALRLMYESTENCVLIEFDCDGNYTIFSGSSSPKTVDDSKMSVLCEL